MRGGFMLIVGGFLMGIAVNNDWKFSILGLLLIITGFFMEFNE